LEIGRDSMAVEILIHVYVDKLLKKVGEREVDSNRIVFDELVPFKGVIFRLLE